jgi:uncharacterized Zn ribbon protein
LIKDLKLKGSSTVLKRGTMIKGIHLTDNADEIEGAAHGVLEEGVREKPWYDQISDFQKKCLTAR